MTSDFRSGRMFSTNAAQPPAGNPRCGAESTHVRGCFEVDDKGSILPKLISVLLAVLLAAIRPAAAEIIWHWEDRFSEPERARLTRWITDTAADVEKLVAPYPFDVHISFYRAERGDSPVPWASTVRSRRQGVNFHVNPDRSLDEFFADWTAPHELSHLLIPWVGRSNAWFTEGFASYMQYQVMHAMRIIDDEQMMQRYRTKIGQAQQRYDLHDIPFVDAAPELVARRQYPTMYWGGALYFLRVDHQLQQRGSSLLEVLRRFVECCRADTRGFDGVVEALDRIAGEPLFSDQLAVMSSRAGFPDDSGIWPELASD